MRAGAGGDSVIKIANLTDLWQTPPKDVDFARRVFGGTIDLDPCAGTDGSVPVLTKQGKVERVWCNATRHAETNLDANANGLGSFWFGNVFVNPPYSELGVWMEAANRWGERDDVNVLALVPATPATQWWQLWAARSNAICLCAKRTKFLRHEGSPGENPRHDVAWLLWAKGPILDRFVALCAEDDRGCVVVPYALRAAKAAQIDAFWGMGGAS